MEFGWDIGMVWTSSIKVTGRYLVLPLKSRFRGKIVLEIRWKRDISRIVWFHREWSRGDEWFLWRLTWWSISIPIEENYHVQFIQLLFVAVPYAQPSFVVTVYLTVFGSVKFWRIRLCSRVDISRDRLLRGSASQWNKTALRDCMTSAVENARRRWG